MAVLSLLVFVLLSGAAATADEGGQTGGCAAVNQCPSGMTCTQPAGGRKVLDQPRPVTAFNGIAVQSCVTVFVNHSTHYQDVLVDADRNYLDKIVVKVDNHILHIGIQPGNLLNCSIFGCNITISVRAPKVDSLTMEGSGRLVFHDFLEPVPKLVARVPGSGFVSALIDAVETRATVSGVGTLSIGQSNKHVASRRQLYAHVSGPGRFSGNNLFAKGVKLICDVTGSIDVTMTSMNVQSDSVEATLNGASSGVTVRSVNSTMLKLKQLGAGYISASGEAEEAEYMMGDEEGAAGGIIAVDVRATRLTATLRAAGLMTLRAVDKLHLRKDGATQVSGFGAANSDLRDDGAGGVHLSFDAVKSLKFVAAGAGRHSLSGNDDMPVGEYAKLQFEGAGEMDASDLRMANVDVSVKVVAAGRILVWAINHLNACIKGNAGVYLRGNATLTEYETSIGYVYKWPPAGPGQKRIHGKEDSSICDSAISKSLSFLLLTVAIMTAYFRMEVE